MRYTVDCSITVVLQQTVELEADSPEAAADVVYNDMLDHVYDEVDFGDAAIIDAMFRKAGVTNDDTQGYTVVHEEDLANI